MQAVLITEERKDEWNSLAAQEAYFALMQSWEWGEYKARLGWKAFRVAVVEGGTMLAGAQVLIKTLPLNVASVAYVPRGPFGHWRDGDVYSLLLAKIDEIAHSWNAVFLKVEPATPPDSQTENLFTRHEFRRSCRCSQPLATIIMNISLDDESILRSMRNSTRRKILTAERKGVQVSAGNISDLPAFFQLMKLTACRAGFPHKSFNYYATEFNTFNDCDRAGFFLAYYQDTLLCAHIIYSYGPHAAFFHQASSGKFCNLNANCLLVWEDIKWAKSRGCVTFDLWGIPDDVDDQSCDDEQSTQPERTDGLWGVYKFKRGFCKDIVRFCGSYDRVYKPLLYHSMMKAPLLDEIENAQVWINRQKIKLTKAEPL
jgi:lipid II:glycine glycyltransferase (peptidoglycan interpeptide bridge formation enzyme)